jgi:hypothetical protein
MILGERSLLMLGGLVDDLSEQKLVDAWCSLWMCAL